MLARAADVGAGVAALRRGSAATRSTVDEGRHAAHQLTGTLGMFGMARGTDVARELELALAARRPGANLRALADELLHIVTTGPATPAPEPTGTTHGRELEPARVLAVDDDPVLLAALAPLLAPLGVTVTGVRDPSRFWEALDEVAPDLVVLSVDMRGLDGVQLCEAIRADPRYADLPVLFLTARTDAETIQRVFSAGADDFVSKPVVGPEFTTRVINRLERARMARRLADRDGLTGLATRRKAEDVLARYIRMADRHDQPLSLAVLDIDHFKSVNDTFGHAAGDAVLRRLATLMQDTFRNEDVLARWGGEEFVVGMYGIGLDSSVARITALLAAFGAAEGSPGTGPVTFSAGVAVYPADGPDCETLVRAADRALYAAKEAGRNRISTNAAEPSIAA